jgi:N-acetylglucosamine malate deacetylase 2
MTPSREGSRCKSVGSQFLRKQQEIDMKASTQNLFYDRPLFIGAHPDDEIITCGAVLQRADHPTVAILTDGAPHDPYFWGAHESREAYRKIRRSEARQALGHLGVKNISFLGEWPTTIADQELHCSLPEAAERLEALVLVAEPKSLITLAYEGGHPDHDTCAFLAWDLGKRFCLPVWECPAYHRKDGKLQLQRFRARTGHEQQLPLSAAELQAKHEAVGLYQSQRESLADYDLALEWIRPQAAYDFTQRPHAGPLNYEVWGWQAHGEEVTAAFREHLLETSQRTLATRA